jgi:cytochrome b subunit of formate dehydrogenase
MLTGIILLISTTGFFLFYVYEMFTNPQMQFQLMVVGLLFSLLWLGYFQLPLFVRKSIKRRIWNKQDNKWSLQKQARWNNGSCTAHKKEYASMIDNNSYRS